MLHPDTGSYEQPVTERNPVLCEEGERQRPLGFEALTCSCIGNDGIGHSLIALAEFKVPTYSGGQSLSNRSMRELRRDHRLDPRDLIVPIPNHTFIAKVDGSQRSCRVSFDTNVIDALRRLSVKALSSPRSIGHVAVGQGAQLHCVAQPFTVG